MSLLRNKTFFCLTSSTKYQAAAKDSLSGFVFISPLTISQKNINRYQPDP